MEPQIKDYYNEMPEGVNVIDKMNEELSEEQEKSRELEKVIRELKAEIEFLKKNLHGIPLFEQIIISQEEEDEYERKFYEIERELEDKLRESVNEEGEINMVQIFNNASDYANILYSKLDTSKEWCEYRVRNAIKEFNVLRALQKYWWEDNILSEGFAEEIIRMIKFSIISGGGTEVDMWNWMGKRDIELRELYLIPCEDCGKYTPLISGGRMQKQFCDTCPVDRLSPWICFDCWGENDED